MFLWSRAPSQNPHTEELAMNWTRIVAITIGTGLLSSLTDWFFGDWIHRRYTYPEIWRQGAEALCS